MNAAEFNRLHPVGTLVFAYPGARPEDIPSARRLITRTRTVAQSVGLDREGVVWVEGRGGYIFLSHVDVVPEAEWEKAKLAAAVAAQGALPMPAGPVPPEQQAYPGELGLLRGLARALRSAARRDDGLPEVRRLLHEHAGIDAEARHRATATQPDTTPKEASK